MSTLRFLSLWVLASWLGADFGAQAIALVRGPEVTPTPTNAVIRWTTDSESGSRVQFGVSPGRLDRRAQGEVGTEHSVVLRELKPGTTYHFTAGTSRVPLVTNSFATPAWGIPAVPVVVSPNPGESPTSPETSPVTRPRPPPTRTTWGSLRSLPDHFERHGADFAAKDSDDYAAQAWLFLVRAKAEGLPAKRDEDGVLRVFDPKSGAFAAYNPDGTTKTYFKPGRRGYFADQPGKTIDLRQIPDLQPPR